MKKVLEKRKGEKEGLKGETEKMGRRGGGALRREGGDKENLGSEE